MQREISVPRRHERVPGRNIASAVALATIAGLASGVHAAERVYLFSDVINSTSGPGAPFFSFTDLRVNSAGQLAFRSTRDVGGQAIVRRDVDGTLHTLATATTNTTNPELIRSFLDIELNETGMVAYQAQFGGTSAGNRAVGIYTIATPTSSPVEIVKGNDVSNAPVNNFSNDFFSLELADNGMVYFDSNLDGTASGESIQFGNGGPLTEVANTTLTTADGGLVSFNRLGTPQVRPNGDVIFNAVRDPFSTPVPDGIYKYDAATGAITTLVDDTDSPTNPLARMRLSNALSRNAAGEIIGHAFYEPDPITDPPGPEDPRTGEYVLFKIGLDDSVTILATGDDAPGRYSLFGGLNLNEKGQFAFLGRVQDPIGPNGYYDGPDALADKVIAVGDTLFGGTIAETSLLGNGLRITESGDLYFVYSIDTDGDPDTIEQTGIAFADRRLLGDASGNDSVGFEDLLTLAQNYNLSTGQSYNTGDFNQDGAIDFADLLILAQNYGVSALNALPSSVSGDFAADWALAQAMVPEPTTALVALSMAGIAGTRRRRSV